LLAVAAVVEHPLMVLGAVAVVELAVSFIHRI
jgi:hypothetical protein